MTVPYLVGASTAAVATSEKLHPGFASGFRPQRNDHAVNPGGQPIQHVSKNLRIFPACPGRHMKGMIGIGK